MTVRREEAEAWWYFIARMIAFFFGMYLLWQEAGPPPGVEVWIIVASIGCMGPTVATAVATVLEAARGSSASPPSPPT